MKKAKLSAIRTDRHYPPGNIPGTNFRHVLSHPRAIATFKNYVDKNSHDTIENRTRDFRLLHGALNNCTIIL